MSLSSDDRDRLKVLLKEAMGKVPPFLKSMAGPSTLTAILKSVPDSFKSYTLGELLEALEAVTLEPGYKW